MKKIFINILIFFTFFVINLASSVNFSQNQCDLMEISHTSLSFSKEHDLSDIPIEIIVTVPNGVTPTTISATTNSNLLLNCEYPMDLYMNNELKLSCSTDISGIKFEELGKDITLLIEYGCNKDGKNQKSKYTLTVEYLPECGNGYLDENEECDFYENTLICDENCELKEGNISCLWFNNNTNKYSCLNESYYYCTELLHGIPTNFSCDDISGEDQMCNCETTETDCCSFTIGKYKQLCKNYEIEMCSDTICSYSYKEILDTPSQGSEFLIAAKQLVAYKINLIYNGACTTDFISYYAELLEDILEQYCLDIPDNKKQEVLFYKTILDNYNNGYIGPGHCGDYNTTTYTTPTPTPTPNDCCIKVAEYNSNTDCVNDQPRAFPVIRDCDECSTFGGYYFYYNSATNTYRLYSDSACTTPVTSPQSDICQGYPPENTQYTFFFKVIGCDETPTSQYSSSSSYSSVPKESSCKIKKK